MSVREVSTSKSQETRNRLLDAAERVVVEHGALDFTLEAVAAEAGVSKGGLLYHFPSKNQLAAALVERAVAGVDATLAGAASDNRPGAFARAYIRVTLGAEPDHCADPLSAALVGVLAVDPTLLDPLRAAYGRWQERLEHDGIPPTHATLVRLAVDGWWMSLVLGLPPLPRELSVQVRARLDELAS